METLSREASVATTVAAAAEAAAATGSAAAAAAAVVAQVTNGQSFSFPCCSLQILSFLSKCKGGRKPFPLHF